jgi:hypothetical protein
LWACLSLASAAGCSSGANECADRAQSAPAASTGGEAASARETMVGTWAEYWSVAGQAATAQYVFHADGTYSWQAVPQSEPTVAARAGKWELVDGTIVLTATSQDERPGCPTACETGGARRVPLDPPIVERLTLDVCPPNDEARKLDASYTCVSLGERAFWRR